MSRTRCRAASSRRSIRALPILCVPGTGREPELNERQLHARRRVHESLQALGGLSSPAGSCAWHVVGLQRSVREWAMRQEWGGRRCGSSRRRGFWSRRSGCWRHTQDTVRRSTPLGKCCLA